MLKFKQLLETLSDRQRAFGNDAHHNTSIHDDLFNNPPVGAKRVDDDTFTIPLVGDVDRSRENEIAEHLKPHGINITDYVGNQATDKHGRMVSISKSLGRLGHDPNLYASDPRVRAKAKGEITPDTYEAVISRGKDHLLGMSSGRTWTSCMTLPGNDFGDNRHYEGGKCKELYGDMRQGTLIAYLVPKGKIKPNTELDKDDAVARILLKRHESLTGMPDVFIPERSYSGTGTGSGNSKDEFPIFNDTIKKFANKRWKMKAGGNYVIHPDLYDDSSHGVYSDGDDISFKDAPYPVVSNVISRLQNRPRNLETMIPNITEHEGLTHRDLDNLFYLASDSDGYNMSNYERERCFDYIAKHKNVDNATLEKMLDSGHSVPDVVKDKLVKDPEIDDEILQKIRRGSDGEITDAWDEKIAKHPWAASHGVLSDILDNIKYRKYTSYNDTKVNNILQSIVSRADFHPQHREMFENPGDSYSDKWDKPLHNRIIAAITNSSKDESLLHDIALHITHPGNEISGTDEYDIMHNLTKNKNLGTSSLHHIIKHIQRKGYYNDVINNIVSHKNLDILSANDLLNHPELHDTARTILNHRIKTGRLKSMVKSI